MSDKDNYRMKQFYEAYADNEIVSPLVTQIGDYTLKLPDKKQLQQKLHGLFENFGIQKNEGELNYGEDV